MKKYFILTLIVEYNPKMTYKVVEYVNNEGLHHWEVRRYDGDGGYVVNLITFSEQECKLFVLSLIHAYL